MAKNEVFCHFTKTLYVYIYIIRAYLNWTRKFSPLSFPFWEHGIGASFILVEFLVDLVLPSSPFLFNAFSFQNKWSRPACKLLFDIFVMGFSLSFKWWKESVVTENWTKDSPWLFQKVGGSLEAGICSSVNWKAWVSLPFSGKVLYLKLCLTEVWIEPPSPFEFVPRPAMPSG